jgi:amidophosphoribosyltransferase
VLLDPILKAKKVVLVDDSIVRGNSISPVIKSLKESGTKEAHVRATAP